MEDKLKNFLLLPKLNKVHFTRIGTSRPAQCMTSFSKSMDAIEAQ